MADEILQLEARLKDYISGGLNTLEGNLNKFQNTAKNTGGEAEKFGQNIGNLAKRFIPFLTVTGAAMTAVKLFQEAVAKGDALNKLFRQTGVATDELQRMQFVIRNLGGETNSLGMAYKTLNNAQYEAKTKGGETANIFHELNLDFRTHNITVEEVITALSQMRNKQEQTAFGTKLFGRAILDLLPALTASKEEMAKVKEEEEKRIKLYPTSVKALDRLGDSWKNLSENVGNYVGNLIAAAALERGRLSKQNFSFGAGQGEEGPAPKALDFNLAAPTKEEWEAMEKLRKDREASAKQDKDQMVDYLAGAYEEGYDQEKNSLEKIQKLEEELVKEKEKLGELLYDEGMKANTKAEKIAQEKTDIDERAAKREKDIKDRFIQQGFAANSALFQLAESGIRNSKESARKKKDYLEAFAIMEAAASAGFAIAQVWETNATGNVYGNAALSILMGIEAAASVITQTRAINTASFAKGTRFAPGGQSLVGEAGIELITGPSMGNLPRGSTVYNNQETQSILNSGNKTEVYNIYDQSGNLIDTLRRELRSGRGRDLISDIRSRV